MYTDKKRMVRPGLSQVPICSQLYVAIVGLYGLPLFFQVILWPREWELLLNLQEEINARRKGSRDSHLYPKTSPISVRGTSNGVHFVPRLKNPPVCHRTIERAILPGCSDIHLLPSFISFEDLAQKIFLFQIMVFWMLTPCGIIS